MEKKTVANDYTFLLLGLLGQKLLHPSAELPDLTNKNTSNFLVSVDPM